MVLLALAAAAAAALVAGCREASSGDRIDVHTAIAHLGNTSLRYVHRMRGADGREIASLVQAGVQLDLDARRPTALPPAIREAISRLLSKA